MISPFPLQHLLPRALVQEIVDLNHSLDVFLGGLPPLPNECVVKLLWGRVRPVVGMATGYG
jgi:hypothetical protein